MSLTYRRLFHHADLGQVMCWCVCACVCSFLTVMCLFLKTPAEPPATPLVNRLQCRFEMTAPGARCLRCVLVFASARLRRVRPRQRNRLKALLHSVCQQDVGRSRAQAVQRTDRHHSRNEVTAGIHVEAQMLFTVLLSLVSVFVRS